MHYEFVIGEKNHSVALDKGADGLVFSTDSKASPLTVEKIDEHTYSLLLDGHRHLVYAAKGNGKLYIHLAGSVHILEDAAEVAAAGGAGTSGIVDGVQKVIAPMPGKIVKITVADGQKVTKGTTVCIVEAMKMENVVQARLDGTIRGISCAAGDLVDTDKIILEVVSDEAPAKS